MDRGTSLLERFNTYRTVTGDGAAGTGDDSDTVSDAGNDGFDNPDGGQTNPPPEPVEVTDEEIFFEQMRGYNKSMRKQNIDDAGQFCSSWPVEMKASFRNSVLTLHTILSDIIKRVRPDEQEALQKKITELYVAFQYSMGLLPYNPDNKKWFMPELKKKGEVIVALCGMMTMELRLQGCIKPSFGGLRSTPQNAWSELKMYKNNALRAIDTSEYGFI